MWCIVSRMCVFGALKLPSCGICSLVLQWSVPSAGTNSVEHAAGFCDTTDGVRYVQLRIVKI